MDGDLHQRAKALFLEVRELPPEERERHLQRAGAGDRQLADEVRSLLAFDRPATLLERSPLRPPARIVGASRGGEPRRRRPGLLRAQLVGLAALFLLAAAGLWTSKRVHDLLAGMLRDSLETVLEADVAALQAWAARERAVADAWAAMDELRALVPRLVQAARTDGGDGLRQPALLAAPRELLDPLVELEGHRGFAILDREGRFLATSDPASLGLAEELVGSHTAPAGMQLVARIFAGETLIQLPFRRDPMVAASRPVPDEQVLMLVAAPVRDDQGTVLAALVLSLHPERDFTRILRIGRIGESGETYAFDKAGTLLSESRYEGELRQAGVLAPEAAGAAMELVLRDPGGNLLEGHRPATPLETRPLTAMAAAAVAGLDGHDVEGYRDYRGVEVVGAWRWLEPFGIGVATEIDKAEAYRPVRTVETAFWVLLGLLLVAVGVVTLASVRLGRLAHRVDEARRLGQYTLEERIGEGGMGTVYRARHALLRRPTAIKLIRPDQTSPENLARFEREVQLTSELTHPNTVEVYDFGRTEDGVFYYAMEYVDGISLQALVERDGPQPAGRVVAVLRQACGSLQEAHEHGLVHRDVKPANIMLCRRGGRPDVVKVLDFGLARPVHQDSSDELTAPGLIGGTPLYIAPEALRDPAAIDARADLYALGSVAFFLLTGRTVFNELKGPELLKAVMDQPPPAPSSAGPQAVPAGLEALVLACLAKMPEERPASADDLALRLEALRDVPPWTRERALEWWDSQARPSPSEAAGLPAPASGAAVPSAAP